MSNLTIEQKKIALKIAREAVESLVRTGKIPVFKKYSDILGDKRGAFVTLKIQGELRGCIGTFSTSHPLYETIAEMAISSATKDPRFPPVSEDELSELEYQISVLSPRERINDISKIEIGKHGLFISNGYFQGVLLPQVASEHNWDREEFLRHTCLKAGLPPDAWKSGATIEIFSAEVFGEKDIL